MKITRLLKEIKENMIQLHYQNSALTLRNYCRKNNIPCLIPSEMNIRIVDQIEKDKIAKIDFSEQTIYIRSDATKDEEYVGHIIDHELVHIAMGKDAVKDSHKLPRFQEFSDVLNIPEKYRD